MTMLETSLFGGGSDVTLWTMTKLLCIIHILLLSCTSEHAQNGVFMSVVGQACTLQLPCLAVLKLN